MQTDNISLADGRTLGYAEYGDPDGLPLIWLHGNPGSHRDVDLLDPTLLMQHHVRVIAPDRPGIGASSLRPQRTLMDWPVDLAALAAALDLDRFALVGVSGGAPYALACAAAMPHRITRAGIVSGIGPLGAVEVSARRETGPRYFGLAQRSYWLVRGMLWLMQRGLYNAEKFMAQAQRGMPPADVAMLDEPRARQAFLATIHEGLRQGTRGLAWDAVLIANAYDEALQLGTITLPIYLWHGDADRNAPVAMAYALRQQLPNSLLQVLPEEGHFSLFMRHMPMILETLVVPGDYTAGT